jgi:hypothetical protein
MEIDKRLLAPLALLGFLIADVHPGIAGMENVRFCLHRKPAFSPTESVPSLCDDPATTTVEPNYSPNFDNLPCSQYDVNAPLGPSDVYLIVARAGEEGIGGVEFGLRYDGSDPDGMPGTGDETGIVSSRTTWTTCANGLEFLCEDEGSFGGRITWNTTTSCQNQVVGNDGVYAVVGCLHVYAYSPTALNVTDNPCLQSAYPGSGVADCAGISTDFYPLLGPSLWWTILARVQFGTSTSPHYSAYNPCAGVVPVHPSTWGKLKNQYR